MNTHELLFPCLTYLLYQISDYYWFATPTSAYLCPYALTCSSKSAEQPAEGHQLRKFILNHRR